MTELTSLAGAVGSEAARSICEDLIKTIDQLIQLLSTGLAEDTAEEPELEEIVLNEAFDISDGCEGR